MNPMHVMIEQNHRLARFGRGNQMLVPLRFNRECQQFVLARTKSVDNEPLRLESQHSFYHARTAAYSLHAYK